MLPVLTLSTAFAATQDTGSVTFSSPREGVVIARQVADTTEDLCETPCEMALEPGQHRFVAYGKGYVPVRHVRSIAPGDAHTLVAKPASKPLQITGNALTYAGIVGIALGTAAVLTGDTSGDKGGFGAVGGPIALAGTVGLAAGVAITLGNQGRFRDG